MGELCILKLERDGMKLMHLHPSKNEKDRRIKGKVVPMWHAGLLSSTVPSRHSCL